MSNSRDVAKKGDRAIIIGASFGAERHNGEIVNVISDPMMTECFGLYTREWMTILSNEVDHPLVRWIRTACLLPLRDPDADFASTTPAKVGDKVKS